jgi:hypothetical protein
MSRISSCGSCRTSQTPFQAWWVDSLQQVLVEDVVPESPLPKKGTGPICRNGPKGALHKLDLSPFSVGQLHAARGEFEAIQVAVRSRTACRVRLKAEPFCPDLPIRVRTVGRVPIVRGTHHTPLAERVAQPPVDLPDPLFPGNELELQANKTDCFWLDLEVSATTCAGRVPDVVSK